MTEMHVAGRSDRKKPAAVVALVALFATSAVVAQAPSVREALVAPESSRADLQLAPADPTVFRRSAAEFQVTAEPRQARPGDTITLRISAKVEGPYHIYAVDQPWSPDTGGALPTAVELTETGVLKPTEGWLAAPPPAEKMQAGSLLRYHEGEVTWMQALQVPADAPHGEQTIAGAVGYAICTDTFCDPPAGFTFRGTVEVGDTGIDEPARFELTALPDPGAVINLVERVVAARSGGGIEPVAGEPGAVGALGAAGAKPGDQGLIMFIIAALGAGFASLLTPCAFPMVPITVSFFTKRAESEHHRPVTMALVYCGGIIATFTLLGLALTLLFGATFLNKFASNGVLNLAIGLLLAVFALNLFGMYEIRIPSALTRFTASKQGQGGYVGVLFMALTFTITSFTCTLPIVGLVLVWAAKGQVIWPTIGLMTFSFAFSLPFFFLALFPSLLASMPKSGGWMNSVKVVMGFLELGAAVKFLSNTDLVWNGTPVLFSYEFVLVVWIITAALTGLYLLNMFRLPHDQPVEHIGVVRMTLSMVFLVLAVHMGVGLFGKYEPEDRLWAKIKAFAPPKMEFPDVATQVASDPAAPADGPVQIDSGLTYHLDYSKAVAAAKASNSLLFIDFTGLVCVNCREMEQQVFPRPEITAQLRRFVRARLYTDSIPHVPRELRDKLLEQNRELQTGWFGDVTLPSYAIATPEGELLGGLAGQQSADVFDMFLSNGLDQWEMRQAAKQAVSKIADGPNPSGS